MKDGKVGVGLAEKEPNEEVGNLARWQINVASATMLLDGLVGPVDDGAVAYGTCAAKAWPHRLGVAQIMCTGALRVLLCRGHDLPQLDEECVRAERANIAWETEGVFEKKLVGKRFVLAQRGRCK